MGVIEAEVNSEFRVFIPANNHDRSSVCLIGVYDISLGIPVDERSPICCCIAASYTFFWFSMTS
jgi:hypothetical protein